MPHKLQAMKNQTTAYRSSSIILLPANWPMLRVAKLLHCFAPRYAQQPPKPSHKTVRIGLQLVVLSVLLSCCQSPSDQAHEIYDRFSSTGELKFLTHNTILRRDGSFLVGVRSDSCPDCQRSSQEAGAIIGVTSKHPMRVEMLRDDSMRTREANIFLTITRQSSPNAQDSFRRYIDSLMTVFFEVDAWQVRCDPYNRISEIYLTGEDVLLFCVSDVIPEAYLRETGNIKTSQRIDRQWFYLKRAKPAESL